MYKVQYWRGFPGKMPWKAAPMLEVDYFPLWRPRACAFVAWAREKPLALTCMKQEALGFDAKLR